eukprot:1848876-Amphidinium_carterae.1
MWIQVPSVPELATPRWTSLTVPNLTTYGAAYLSSSWLSSTPRTCADMDRSLQTYARVLPSSKSQKVSLPMETPPPSATSSDDTATSASAAATVAFEVSLGAATQRKLTFQCGSSIASQSTPTPAAERTPTPAPREKGDGCVLHVTGFASPLSLKEMVSFAKGTLGLPTEAKVLTRGFYAQRATLRFPTELVATNFLEGFRSGSHKHDGSILYVHRDQAPHERRMSFMLRAAKRVLLKNGYLADDVFLSNRDGVLYLRKYPILSTMLIHASFRNGLETKWLQRWSWRSSQDVGSSSFYRATWATTVHAAWCCV